MSNEVVENKALFTIEGFCDAAGSMYFKMLARGIGSEKVAKKLSYDQMMELLSHNYRQEPVRVPVGQLPSGYLDAVVSEKGFDSVTIYVPAQIRPFLLGIGQKMPLIFNIPMPPMVFRIKSNGVNLHGDCCIVKGSYEEVYAQYHAGKLQGYYYPFGNVSDRGGICMGNIRVTMKSMCDASIFVDAFFDGITNHDYVVSGSRVTVKKGQMELLKALDGKDKFPERWLKKSEFDFLKPVKTK